MKVGGVGAVLCILPAIEEIVAILMLWVSPVDYAAAGPHMDFGGGIVWAVGIALISIGAFGLWKQYKKSFPLVIGIVGIAALALGLVARIILWLDGGAVTSISAIGQGASLLNLIGITGIVWLEITGVFLILLGVGLIQLREITGIKKITMATGALMLTAGAMFCAIIPYGYLVTQVLILTALISMAYVFFKAS